VHSFAAKDLRKTKMASQSGLSSPEFIKTRNTVIAILITVALIFIDQVIHVPLWFSVPFAGAVTIGVRYAYLKQAEAKHSGE
jgi:Flp pilus assembly protein TadB